MAHPKLSENYNRQFHPVLAALTKDQRRRFDAFKKYSKGNSDTDAILDLMKNKVLKVTPPNKDKYLIGESVYIDANGAITKDSRNNTFFGYVYESTSKSKNTFKVLMCN